MPLVLVLINNQFTKAQSIPQYDHVVIVIMENHAFESIVGSSSAPYINSLISGTSSASFNQSFGLTHPSQPNYIMLYSGSNQGVLSDSDPSTFPFTSANLGASLLSNSLTFKGYSEDLPSVGYNGSVSGNYARKHNPWVNWQNATTNGIPSTSNQPFSSFPADFTNLPTVSFVIPNQLHDMHIPPITPTVIPNGDAWLNNYLDSYVQWAKTHNSLFILTFDEDDGAYSNHITTIFVGANVLKGVYTEHINHYNILRTIEDMYGLPYAGNSSTALPITNCWISNTTEIQNSKTNVIINLFPNPTNESLTINFYSNIPQIIKINVTDLLSRTIINSSNEVHVGNNKITLPSEGLASGTYIVNVISAERSIVKKVIFKK